MASYKRFCFTVTECDISNCILINYRVLTSRLPSLSEHTFTAPIETVTTLGVQPAENMVTANCVSSVCVC